MKMFIEKFGKEVEIDEDHPLAVAQREKNAGARSGRLDGEPDVRNADGLIHGDPLNLTEDERTNIPPLEPATDGTPAVTGAGAATDQAQLPENIEDLSKAELAEFAFARFGLELEKSEMNKVSMLDAIRSAHSAEAAS